MWGGVLEYLDHSMDSRLLLLVGYFVTLVSVFIHRETQFRKTPRISLLLLSRILK